MSAERCPGCGTPYESDADFCINCGAKRQAPAPAAPAAPQTPAAPAPAAPEPAATPPEPAPPAATTPPPAAAAPTPPPAPEPVLSEDEVLKRLDEKVAPKPVDEVPVTDYPPTGTAKKKSKKGCCIAVIIAAVVLVLAAACVAGLYYGGVLDNLNLTSGGGYANDFTSATTDDLTVWQLGKGGSVQAENGALRVTNALVGVKYDPGKNYTATCTVTVGAIKNPAGWAGLVLRVNPQGGDRYAFELLPQSKTARIELIPSKGNPQVLVAKTVPELVPRRPFRLGATVSGQDLTMSLEDVVVAKTTYIGLAEGPMGFEARDATAFFDDLSVKPE